MFTSEILSSRHLCFGFYILLHNVFRVINEFNLYIDSRFDQINKKGILETK